ncbi:alpha/beta-hydrolase [Calocera cornea HHB12733]|uniref:Alpha/beta-hydrolase n=1 Tax=Calocera cornea HHB12733 TaxID=1353952 RepID=A0A165EFC6_9BASI|nr:alpha/beta-hydrolase [Calocera cornea HHB12733]
MLTILRQLSKRARRMTGGSHIGVQHILVTVLFVLWSPVTLPICIGVAVMLLATDRIARQLSLSVHTRPQPAITHLRPRLKAGLYAIRWFLQTVNFAPIALKSTYILALDGVGRRSTARQQLRIANVPVDVYAASIEQSHREDVEYPIVVLLHGYNYGPLVCRRWMLVPIARTLQTLGCSVIVPEVDAKNTEDMEAIIRDLKSVLAWVGLHAGEMDGDADNVYIMGHGFGAYMALLLSVQSAAVQSRDDFRLQHPENDVRHPEVVLPNGLTEARIYAPEIESLVPKGLILLAPISDTQKYLEWEVSQGVTGLSPMRQILGRSCLFHSPAHLLFAARSVLTVEYLPSKMLIIHGGRDVVVQPSQSNMLEELLTGGGMLSVQKSFQPGLDHIDLLKGLDNAGLNKVSPVLNDVMAFVM